MIAKASPLAVLPLPLLVPFAQDGADPEYRPPRAYYGWIMSFERMTQLCDEDFLTECAIRKVGKHIGMADIADHIVETKLSDVTIPLRANELI